jgi:hypothetical protein
MVGFDVSGAPANRADIRAHGVDSLLKRVVRQAVTQSSRIDGANFVSGSSGPL